VAATKHIATARAAFVGLVALVTAVLPAAPRAFGDGDIGVKDFQYATSGKAQVTYGKPESKLWYAAGSWWAVMLPPAGGYRILQLDRSTNAWTNTGVTVDTRRTSHPDVLWDGTSLYVASHVYCDNCSNSGKPTYLYRYSYVGGSFVLDPGFPVLINNTSSETLVIDKDGTGTLWATWVQGPSGARQVYVADSVGGDDHTWSAPFVPPVGGTSVANDDISSLVRFGSAVGLLWSNQGTNSFDFSMHLDGDDPLTWSATEVASGGPKTHLADDHINLKADSTGRVYAAVKTSKTRASMPLIQVLVRDETGGWAAYTVSNYSQVETRPIVLLDASTETMQVFMTGPPHGGNGLDSGGSIYVKSSSTVPGSISFGNPDDPGTLVMSDSTPTTGPYINNATSTKQDLANTDGVVVLASNSQTMFYWHYDSSLLARVSA
jgi:hypothetical protein